MAIAFDNATFAEDATNGATTSTFAHTVGTGSNRVLIVSMAYNVGAFFPTVTITYNGVAMTRELRAAAGVANEIWYLANPASGTNNVVVTVVLGADYAQYYSYIASSYEGVLTTGLASENSQFGIAGSTNATLEVTTVNTGAWVVGHEFAGSASYTITNGLKRLEDINTALGYYHAFIENGPYAAAVTGGFSSSNGGQAIGMTLSPFIPAGPTISTIFNAGREGKLRIAPPRGTVHNPILDGSGHTNPRTHTLVDRDGTVIQAPATLTQYSLPIIDVNGDLETTSKLIFNDDELVSYEDDIVVG